MAGGASGRGRRGVGVAVGLVGLRIHCLLNLVLSYPEWLATVHRIPPKKKYYYYYYYYY